MHRKATRHCSDTYFPVCLTSHLPVPCCLAQSVPSLISFSCLLPLREGTVCFCLVRHKAKPKMARLSTYNLNHPSRGSSSWKKRTPTADSMVTMTHREWPEWPTPVRKNPRREGGREEPTLFKLLFFFFFFLFRFPEIRHVLLAPMFS